MIATDSRVINESLTGNGGAYLRVSDDGQEIATQHKTIADFQTRNGVNIDPTRIYEDIAWSRDEVDKRPDWLRMLADVDAGKLQWIVVSAKDRFGTASGRKKVNLYSRLWDAGCKLILASTGEVLNAPNLSSDITALVDGEQEQQELRQKSDRALEKMRQHAKRGRWMGGVIPFGFDVVCMDVQGREFWRVQLEGRDVRIKITPDGNRQTFEGRNNFPGRDPGQFLTLRPTIASTRLDIVRDVFNWIDGESLSTYQIAARLNQRGDRHPLGEWPYHIIETMLANMAYIGQPTWNRTSQGKWSEHTGGVTRPHLERNTRSKDHARDDWIYPSEPLFDAIVPVDQFNRVQIKLAGRKQKPRAPKSPQLWLTGLLFCTHCGGKMHGTVKAGVPSYICGNYLRTLDGRGRIEPSTKRTDEEKQAREGKPVTRACKYYMVAHAEAEGWLREFFAETGQLWPSPRSKVAVPWSEKTAWTDSITSMAASVGQMIDRIKATHPTLRHIPDPNKPAKKYRVTDLPDGLDVPTLYRTIFSSEKEQWTARLDQVETDHTKAFKAWNEAPTARTKAKAKTSLDELEVEIEAIEKKLANAGDTYDQARNEITQLRADWLSAASAIETDTSARQKAATVRKVIARVELTFAESGLKRRKHYAAQVEIKPVAGSLDSDSNVVTSGPRPTAKNAATRACACGICRSRSTKPPRDHWILLMGQALDEADLPPADAELLRHFLFSVAHSMQNR